ncbi:hypothetical protein [Paenibacillus kandeliae]|uniref:hypothetical protein n=1 Tax=Paenibacillus kandeliae TaxID=3231269 RepID=UPI00345A36F1
MDHIKTLRHEIIKELQKQNYSLSMFSNLSGVNRGILSSTLNSDNPKPISINQLDRMGKALQKPQGWLYEIFIQELFGVRDNLNWRRIRALLLNCIEINQFDWIRYIVDMSLEKYEYIEKVFELAEELVHQEKLDAAMICYQSIVDNERYSHSERLAISYYRMYMINRDQNIEDDYQTAVLMQQYQKHLPDHLRLQALTHAAGTYYWVKNWILLEQCADELISLTNRILNKFPKTTYTDPYFHLDIPRPFVRYYGQSYLIKGTFYEHTGDYEKALEYAYRYYDLTHLRGISEESDYEIDKLYIYAQGNIYGMNLHMSKFEILDNYVDFLKQNPEEIVPGLLLILTVANRQNTNVDWIVKLFENQIDSFLTNKSKTYYASSAVDGYFVNMVYQLALYQSKQKKNYKQLQRTLKTFERSASRYNMKRTIDMTPLLTKLIQLP